MAITETLHHGDCEKGMRKLKKESVDLIFTDPPYIAEMWEQAYTILAKGAFRILKPGGFCITYCPQYRLDSVMDIMRDAGLVYFWIIPQLCLSDKTAMVHPRRAICLHKPILVFSKPPIKKPPRAFVDVVRGKRQKAYHPWQQSIHDALGVISRFADSGQLLADPFTGSGTSLLAAQLLGLRIIGWEIKQETYQTAIGRLQQQPLTLSTFLAAPVGEVS